LKQAKAVGGKGLESLRFEEVDAPVPGPGEALVRINAATLNFRDLLFIEGRLPGMTKVPDYVPLSCGAGVVEAVGAGVTRVRPGDRVSPIFALGWLEGPIPTMAMLGGLADGVARSHAVFAADSLVINPPTLGDMDAATYTCAGVTAWNALFRDRPIQPGEWVLCPGTGGVSIAALQFAKAAGANVALTSSSDAKLTRGRALGADVTFNYHTDPDWRQSLMQASGGIDIIVDVVGADELDANAALLKPGGIIAAIGMLGSDFSWHEAQVGGHPISRITVGNRADHEATLAFVKRHAIRPVVDAIYPLDRLGDALQHLKSGAFFGKVGITLL
jgi:NADPH:quinone reductase-like Zn-dependent oxidoreductase